MTIFRNQKELNEHKKEHIVTSGDRALLIHPDGKAPFEAPADQVRHYLNKGFKWSKS